MCIYIIVVSPITNSQLTLPTHPQPVANTRMFFGSAVCNIKTKQIGNRPNAHQQKMPKERQHVRTSEQGCMKSLLQKDMYRAATLS